MKARNWSGPSLLFEHCFSNSAGKRDNGPAIRVATQTELGARGVPNIRDDPAAGSFIVLRAAAALGRDFVGCDITADGLAPANSIAEAAGTAIDGFAPSPNF
jgi:hypothetical protein